MKIMTLSLALVLFAFGCSKKEAVINLGVIELSPNVPKHINVGGIDWTITETLGVGGKQTITAESEHKATQADISGSLFPPGTEVGATIKNTLDMSGLPTGVEITGYFGGKLTRYTLRHDTN